MSKQKPARLSVVDEPDVKDGEFNISDFDKEMRQCVELDEELDRYFNFLSKLSRDELLAIVKYEVYNRVLVQQNQDLEKK